MKIFENARKYGVRHWHVYMFGFSVVVFGSIAAMQDARIKEKITLDYLREVELAYSQQAPSAAEVLGARLDNNSANIIQQIGKKGQTVLQKLQENHVVIVEYTENGTFVKSIDGAGSSEDDSETNLRWSYSINGNEASVSADRFIPQDGDVILWEYK